MKLTIDFETRSAVKLTGKDGCGSWVYSKDKTTQAICLAVACDKKPVEVFVAPYFYNIIKDLPETKKFNIIDSKILIKYLKKARTIEAHNAQFEMDMYYNHILKNIDVYCNFPEIPYNKWRCSAAKAAAHALPRSLEGASLALNLVAQKDMDGNKVMYKLCKPRNPRKKEREENPEWEKTLYWNEDPQDFIKLIAYCIQDVETERELSNTLLDLNIKEQKVWHLDAKINRNGIPVDLESVKNAIDLINNHKYNLIRKFRELTDNDVQNPTQRERLFEYIKEKGYNISNLQKETVEKALHDPTMPENVRQVLEIRQSISKSSTAKLEKFIKCTDKETNRAHGCFLYHGAATGRWGGRLIQPHNFPRGKVKNIEDVIKAVEIYKGSPNIISMLFGDPMDLVSNCLRGFIATKKGKQFLCSDYSAIEARVLPWLANEQKILDAFIKGLDLYKVAAADIYNVRYEDVTDIQRQVGKVVILALGYQGAWRAFMAMALAYGVNPPDHITLDSDDYYDFDGTKLTKIEAVFKKWATPIVAAWRLKNQNIKQLWYDTERAAIEAIKTGKVTLVGKVKWGVHKNFLMCRLPSGRFLSYYKPFISLEKNSFGVKETIKFWGEKTGKYGLQTTYGGKLVENITQAVARDILVESMLELDKKGFRIVLHVHDEIVAEIDEGTGDIKKFEKIMATNPSWCKDLPLAADGGWIGYRYRK